MALDRLGLGVGWRCVDVGAGGGDVSVALAEMVGRMCGLRGRQRSPARDEVARDAAAYAQVLALTQAGEDLSCPSRSTSRSAGSSCCTCQNPPPSSTNGQRGPAGRLGRGARADHVRLLNPRRPAADVDARRGSIPMLARRCPRWSGTRRSRWSTPGRKRLAGVGPGAVVEIPRIAHRCRSG